MKSLLIPVALAATVMMTVGASAAPRFVDSGTIVAAGPRTITLDDGMTYRLRRHSDRYLPLLPGEHAVVAYWGGRDEPRALWVQTNPAPLTLGPHMEGQPPITNQAYANTNIAY